MNDLIIEATEDTPEVNLNASTGVLRITGRAFSNDIAGLFKKINDWLDQYILNPVPETTLMLQIDYSNSVSNRLVYDLVVKCKGVLDKGKNLKIKWYHYEDSDDSIYYANLVAKLINFPIENIETD